MGVRASTSKASELTGEQTSTSKTSELTVERASTSKTSELMAERASTSKASELIDERTNGILTEIGILRYLKVSLYLKHLNLKITNPLAGQPGPGRIRQAMDQSALRTL